MNAEEWVRSITSVLLGGGLFLGIAALRTAGTNRRAGVAGDEREARRDEAQQRRDTVADRDAFIEKLAERVEQLETRDREKDARITLLEQERDFWRGKYNDEYDYSRRLQDQIYRGETHQGPIPRPAQRSEP